MDYLATVLPSVDLDFFRTFGAFFRALLVSLAVMMAEDDFFGTLGTGTFTSILFNSLETTIKLIL